MNLLQKLLISTYLFMNSVAIPIIHNHGCCIQYSYGSMMQPCCHKLTDVLNNSECNDTGLLGSGSEFVNMSCNQVNLNNTNSIIQFDSNNSGTVTKL